MAGQAGSRWGSKEANGRRLRYHEAEPTSVVVLFGMSFERAPDVVRIEAHLQADPTIKVISVSLHPAPVAGEDGAMPQLGTLGKFHPTRYEHCETNFREERGLKTLIQKILQEGKPTVGYLDYAWLQVNHFFRVFWLLTRIPLRARHRQKMIPANTNDSLSLFCAVLFFSQI